MIQIESGDNYFNSTFPDIHLQINWFHNCKRCRIVFPPPTTKLCYIAMQTTSTLEPQSYSWNVCQVESVRQRNVCQFVIIWTWNGNYWIWRTTELDILLLNGKRPPPVPLYPIPLPRTVVSSETDSHTSFKCVQLKVNGVVKQIRSDHMKRVSIYWNW